MVRAHVAALGGNAVVSYSMKECVFMENPNKNQVNTCTVTYTDSYTHNPSRLLINAHVVCFTGAVPNQRQWGRCYFRPRIWVRVDFLTDTVSHHHTHLQRWGRNVNTHTHSDKFSSKRVSSWTMLFKTVTLNLPTKSPKRSENLDRLIGLVSKVSYFRPIKWPIFSIISE